MPSDTPAKSDVTEAQEGVSKAEEGSKLRSDTLRSAMRGPELPENPPKQDKERVFTPEALAAEERADRALEQKERKYQLMVEEAFRNDPPEPTKESGDSTTETKESAPHVGQESKALSDVGRKAMGGYIRDDRFNDWENRPITIRTFEQENGSMAYIRAYDEKLRNGKVPDTVTHGDVGNANVQLKQAESSGGPTRVYIDWFKPDPQHPDSGIGDHMADKVIEYGKKHDAAEIYGPIESQNEYDFWTRMERRSWTIRQDGSPFGQVHYRLK